MKRKRAPFLVIVLMVIGLIGIVFGAAPPAASKSRKPAEVLLAAGRAGDAHYVMSQALAHFVKKKSDWLRVIVTATPGITANEQLIQEKPTKYISVSAYVDFIMYPKEKRYKNYDKIRVIANATSNTFTFITYDPKIKSVADASGKTVNAHRKATILTPWQKEFFRLAGATNIKWVHSGTGGAAKNLKDGLVDVATSKVDRIYPHTWKKGSRIEELEIRGPVYFVSVPKEIQLKAQETVGSAFLPSRVPPGALGKNQPDPVYMCGSPLFFGCDAQMDPEIVYEIARVIAITPAKEWAPWHPQGQAMTESQKYIYIKSPDESMHPGALRYYREHGIKLVDLAVLVLGE